MKATLEKLFDQQSLNTQEAFETLCAITRGEVNDSHIAAFMTVYRMREVTLKELRGFREALLSLAMKVDLPSEEAIDLCGTGGDNRNSFNISTLSCFVVAAAGGRVIKHGNYGVSSVSGSSTVLEQVGYRFTTNNGELERSLDESGVCFLHAPLFHSALKNVGVIRKQLGVRTFFNMMGPLVNPAQPKHRLTGVFSNELLRKYNYLLQSSNENYTLVHSEDGFDEISLTAPVKVVTRVSEDVFDAEELGLPTCTVEELYGGATVQDAAELFLEVLRGHGTIAQSNVVAVNAGYALYNLGITLDPRAGFFLALEMLRSGKANETFKKFMQIGTAVKAK